MFRGSLVVVALLTSGLILSSCRKEAEDNSNTRLVNNYLNWVPPKGSADFPNPYEEKVVAAGAAIVPDLIKAQGSGTKVSQCIVQALGQIGVPESFEFLLKAYKTDPGQCVALAIGSSWRAGGVEETFKALDENALRNLLSIVLGNKWASLKDKNANELKDYVNGHLDEIIKECKNRSRGILG